MNSTFGAWPESIHNDPEQQKRMLSASKAALTPVEIYSDKSAQFSGKSGRYITTLNDCQCVDFSMRHLPCKHIYRLAYEVEGFDLGNPVKTSRKAIIRPDEEVIEEFFDMMVPYLDELPTESLDPVCMLLEIISHSGRLSLTDKALDYLAGK